MKNDVIFNIKELHHLIGKAMFNEDINLSLKYKPSGTQIRFIDYLCKHSNEEVMGRDLEKEFNLSRATVSDVLNTMEKHRIITRVVSDNDTRSKIIILNDEYKEIHKKINIEINKIKRIITNDLNNDEIVLFNKVINKMKLNINEFLDKQERNDDNDKNV